MTKNRVYGALFAAVLATSLAAPGVAMAAAKDTAQPVVKTSGVTWSGAVTSGVTWSGAVTSGVTWSGAGTSGVTWS